MKILITSGGTRVPIDQVRHIGNMSSGRFGADLARQALLNGHEVYMLRAKTSFSPARLACDVRVQDTSEFDAQVSEMRKVIHRYQELVFTTYDSYLTTAPTYVSAVKPDIIIAAAAVSDFVLYTEEKGKIDSSKDTVINLKPTSKVLPFIRRAGMNAKLVGFKLMVGHSAQSPEATRAVQRTMDAGPCDMVAFNNLDDIKRGTRTYTLFAPGKPPIEISDYRSKEVRRACGSIAEQFMAHVEKL